MVSNGVTCHIRFAVRPSETLESINVIFEDVESLMMTSRAFDANPEVSDNFLDAKARVGKTELMLKSCDGTVILSLVYGQAYVDMT